jgi:hypothetical protein
VWTTPVDTIIQTVVDAEGGEVRKAILSQTVSDSKMDSGAEANAVAYLFFEKSLFVS